MATPKMTFLEYQNYYELVCEKLKSFHLDGFPVIEFGVTYSRIGKLLRLLEEYSIDYDLDIMNKALTELKNNVTGQHDSIDLYYGEILGELETINDLITEYFNEKSPYQTHFVDFLEFDDSNLDRILKLLNQAKLNINSHPLLSPKSKTSLIEQLNQVIKELTSKSKKKDIINIFGKLKSVWTILSTIGNLVALANDGTQLFENIFENDNSIEEANKLIEQSLVPSKTKGDYIFLQTKGDPILKLIENTQK